jgi:nucleoside-diphosphate-sugar epimerase
MPVIVVGADTNLGSAVIDALLPQRGELRAFVTDPEIGRELHARGVKVAIGDVSDGSHVGGAALHTFCAVLVPTAANDDRERSFADSPEAVIAAWADGLRDGGVRRAIWLDDGTIPDGADLVRPAAPEFATVAAAGRPVEEIAAEVARLDAARSLT